jgi:hypothetical protein
MRCVTTVLRHPYLGRSGRRPVVGIPRGRTHIIQFGVRSGDPLRKQVAEHIGGYRTLHVGRAVTVGNEAARCPGWEVRCPAGQSRLLPPGPCWRPAVKRTHPLCRKARPGHRCPRIARQLKRSARQVRSSPANSSAQSHGGTASGTSSANYRPNSASYRFRSQFARSIRRAGQIAPKAPRHLTTKVTHQAAITAHIGHCVAAEGPGCRCATAALARRVVAARPGREPPRRSTAMPDMTRSCCFDPAVHRSAEQSPGPAAHNGAVRARPGEGPGLSEFGSPAAAGPSHRLRARRSACPAAEVPGRGVVTRRRRGRRSRPRRRCGRACRRLGRRRSRRT